MPLINSVKAQFTRPATHTAFAQFDAVSNSATAPSPMTFKTNLPEGSWQWISGVRITDSDVATVAANWRLYLITGSQAPQDTGAAFDDDAALALTEACTENWPTSKLQTVYALDTAYNTGVNQRYEYWTEPRPIQVGSTGDIYGILQVNNAYDPSAVSNTITVELILEADKF